MGGGNLWPPARCNSINFCTTSKIMDGVLGRVRLCVVAKRMCIIPRGMIGYGKSSHCVMEVCVMEVSLDQAQSIATSVSD